MTIPPVDQRYALQFGDQYFVFLTSSDTGHSVSTITFEWDRTHHMSSARTPVKSTAEPAAMKGWWRAINVDAEDGAPDRIVVQPAERERTIGYRLSEEYRHLESDKYPYELAADDERMGWHGYGDEDPKDPIAQAAYVKVREKYMPDAKTIEGFLLLEGSPPPADDHRAWTAQMPFQLQHATEYLHLFPGHLSGFRAAAKEVLEAIPELRVTYYHTQHSIYVKPLSDGMVSYLYTDDNFHVNDSIHGENRADAVDRWDVALAELVERVRAASQACSHCEGTGLSPERLQRRKELAARTALKPGRGRRGRR